MVRLAKVSCTSLIQSSPQNRSHSLIQPDKPVASSKNHIAQIIIAPAGLCPV
ncbi:Uncharacterised protein [Vibrio cholerae]|uniref:Uncharacterized protein n=1 Tax=Vibrio cholerae TaxID=666 RepID=A0A655XQN1_VIBCL|nr:Uncharacterised protein [Vibrio cholerae]CSB93132.1 Uncharacterised protein [Vibrio cholerae]CSC20674.1 Uncharacterised protein [Vibrio cholerae]CSC30963.1 Uncharacterised protein [Vibrio cholerae]